MILLYLPLYALFNLLAYNSDQEVITATPAKDTHAIVLERVSNRLGNLKNISYQYKRELNYASEDYFHELVVDTYLEFAPTEHNLNFKYQADDAQHIQVNNGAEIFVLNKKSKAATIDRKPALSSLQDVSFLYNSPVTLRHMLPLIVKDNAIIKTIADTTLNGNNYHTIRFELKGKVLNNVSGYRELAAGTTIRYQLLIDPATYFPVEVLQRNNLNNDFIRTSFTNIDFAPAAPSESSWYYSSYSGIYKVKAPKEFPGLIKAGTLAPKPAYVIIINDEIATKEQLDEYAKQGYVKSMAKGVTEEQHAKLVKQLGEKIGSREFIVLISLFTEEEKKARDAGTSTTTTETRPAATEELVLKVNDAAKDFTVSMIDGKTIKLSDLKGKVVLINFWATWCAPCLLEFYDFPSKIIEPNKNSAFVLLPISRGETKEKVTKKMADLKKKGIDFNVGTDPDEAIWNQYAKGGIPQNFLIDKNGVIRHVSVGYGEANIEKLAKEIQKLLKE